jgi:putative spermidine/putrescine transport system ATP-binding protein
MSYGTLKDITVSYDGKNNILENLNLEIGKGELLSLLGPSGCGKTTTLRVIAGLMPVSGGTFTLDGTDMTKVPVHARSFGVVFQSYALFPHQSVHDNIAFGLKLRKVSASEIEEKVHKMADLCGISEFLDRLPRNLSGGQRQRVALARALVIEPKLLLLDEPLSNLDAQLRIQMRTTIKRIQRELGITTIFVTHDQEECFSISDRVAVMDKGKIVQCDTPEAIFHHPTNEMVARFVGFRNFAPAETYRKLGARQVPDGLCCSRPASFSIIKETGSALQGKIEVRSYLGNSYQYEVGTEAGVFSVSSSCEPPLSVGDKVGVSIAGEDVVSFGA